MQIATVKVQLIETIASIAHYRIATYPVVKTVQTIMMKREHGIIKKSEQIYAVVTGRL